MLWRKGFLEGDECDNREDPCLDGKRAEEIRRALESQRKLLYFAADFDSAPLAADLHFHMLV